MVNKGSFYLYVKIGTPGSGNKVERFTSKNSRRIVYSGTYELTSSLQLLTSFIVTLPLSMPIRASCLAKPGVTEGFPFGQDVLVFKVMNKMFALTGLDGNPPYVNLKCDPERAIDLREQYEDIKPGYHMHKIIITF